MSHKAVNNNYCLFGFQFDALDLLYKILIVTIYICMIIVEIIRIYIGYVGNLSEKVTVWQFSALLLTAIHQ